MGMLGSESGEPLPAAHLYEEARWYACYTRARHEKRVERVLRDRGIDSYLPTVARESQWKDRRKTVDWPLFPGYVFGRFTLRDVHTVLTTPGIATIVRSNGYPTPIPDDELENVRRVARVIGELGELPPVRPMLAKGQPVVISDGPFKGIFGFVAQLRNRGRVLVGLASIGQGLEIEVNEAFVKPLDAG